MIVVYFGDVVVESLPFTAENKVYVALFYKVSDGYRVVFPRRD